MTRRRETGSPRTSREAEILAAALALFHEQGFEKASIQQIADRVGLLKGSLYYYVESKEQILFDLLADVHLRLSASAIAALEGLESAPTPERLHALILNHLRFVAKNTQGIGVFLSDFRSLEDGNRRKIRAMREEYEALLLSVIEQGQERNELRQDVPPRLVMLALLGMLNWTPQWLPRRSPHTVEEIADFYTELVVSGVAVTNQKHRGRDQLRQDTAPPVRSRQRRAR